MSKSKIVTVEQDPDTGDLILPLSDELMGQLDWKIGDTVRWSDNGDGTWSLYKFEEQLEFDFDEKDDAILSLLTENQRLKAENEELKRENKEIRTRFEDDYK